jgi:hypothetical protein
MNKLNSAGKSNENIDAMKRLLDEEKSLSIQNDSLISKMSKLKKE